MGLKCSVIGHKYGDSEVEREREEQGSEVVITIQEREACERCGKTRVVSENKEVTAIETPSDIAGDMLDDEESAEEAPPADEAAPDEASPADESPTATEGVETDDGATEETPSEQEAERDVADDGGPDDGVVGAVDPETDDAEILDGDDETPSGGDSELEDPSTEVSMAESDDTEASAVASDPEADDGVIIDGESETSAGEDRQPGEWPDEPDDDADDWAPKTEESAEEWETKADVSDEDGEAESPDVEPFGGSAVTVPEGQFRCPECEFTTDVASSSLRAGDFCPECHMGALVNTAE